MGGAGQMFTALFYYNLALADCYLGDYALAKTELQTSVDISKSDRAFFLLGNICSDYFHEYPEAIQAYSNALEKNDSIEYRLSRAAAYEQNGQFSEAEQDYMEVLDREPENQIAKDGLKRLQAG